MKMSSDDEKKIVSEQRAIVALRNDDLVCKDCLLRYDDSYICGNVSSCEAYPNHSKPQSVLDGEECSEYVKE